MPAKKNGHSNGNGHKNGHSNGNGRKNDKPSQRPWSYDFEKTERKMHAIQMFLSGSSVTAIAKELACDIRTVFKYISETRAQVLAEKRGYFDELVSGLLEQNLEALQTTAGLFADREFLETTSADKIHALAVLHGILSDKTYILIGAAVRHQERAQLGPGDAGDGDHE